MIWVIDSQDEYLTSINELLRTAVFLAEHYPRINFEVFIHKTDGLSDEYKYDTFREVRQRVQDELSDIGYGNRSVSYYQTSIFDHSIYEAISKVVQRLLPQLPALEALLNRLCSTCGMQKAYLFDTVSKIYVATDASPTFLKDYEVCSDYVDVIVDIKALYGWQASSKKMRRLAGSSAQVVKDLWLSRRGGRNQKHPDLRPRTPLPLPLTTPLMCPMLDLTVRSTRVAGVINLVPRLLCHSVTSLPRHPLREPTARTHERRRPGRS